MSTQNERLVKSPLRDAAESVLTLLFLPSQPYKAEQGIVKYAESMRERQPYRVRSAEVITAARQHDYRMAKAQLDAAHVSRDGVALTFWLSVVQCIIRAEMSSQAEAEAHYSQQEWIERPRWHFPQAA